MSHQSNFISRIVEAKLSVLGGIAALLIGSLAVLGSRTAHLQSAASPATATPMLAAAAGAAAFSDEQKKELGEIIKDYLIKHPEVLSDAQTALEAKLEKEQIGRAHV